MSIEMVLISGVISCVIGVLSFLGGKLTAAKQKGQEWGELKTDMKYIKEGIAEIKSIKEGVTEVKSTVAIMQSATKDSIALARADAKESVAALHERIDDHLRDVHGIPVPRRAKREGIYY